MMKRIAVINDLSGFGRCSLTAAISVIAAMGSQPCPLPTAVLSSQSCYPSYYCCDFTDQMDEFRKEWKKMNVSFSGIYTGYMAGKRQIGIVRKFLEDFHRGGTFLIVDPVMGDEGKPYDMFTADFLSEMKEFVKEADIITPNVTELCLLAGGSYEKVCSIEEKDMKLNVLKQMADSLPARGPRKTVITGIRFRDPEDGIMKLGNMTVSKGKAVCTACPVIGNGYSGTGDLFASVIAGGMARGDSPECSAELAGRFIARAIMDSVKEKVPENDGVNYEQFLYMLTEKKGERL